MEKTKKPNRIKKLILILFVFLLFLTAAVGVGAYIWYTNAVNSQSGDPEQEYAFEVREGDTLLSIAPKLQELGILSSVEAFQIYLRLNPTEVELLVGAYDVTGGINFEELLTQLDEGPTLNTVLITIPEGLRNDEISEIFATKLSAFPESPFSKSDYEDIFAKPNKVDFSSDVQEFLDQYKPKSKPLEGFLFPDTYVIASDASAQDIIELQIRTLIRRLEENRINPDQETRVKNFYEVLTLATIVEREALEYKDMRIVAHIFLKRMEIGEIIGADAPLLYPKKDWSYELTLADILDASNPYNLRARQGLPPTPISNPGINPIKSVFNPRKTDHLYFVSADGKNYYAATLPEHCVNIQRYLGGSC